jgi:DNA-binding NarL/FixJ family response regulator
MAIRVVLAEDNLLVRAGVVGVLASAPDIEVVGEAGDLGDVERLIAELEPDVVVTDIRMPPTGTDEGIRLAARLREERASVGVVVLSQHEEPAYALALLEAGAGGRAYLLKERVAEADDLADAVRQVASGGSVIDPRVVEGLVSANRPARRTEVDRLTPREREVLGEMAQGKSNAAIAATLVLSERAVEKHTNSIFSKLGLTEERDVNRRVKAVLLFLDDAGGS